MKILYINNDGGGFADHIEVDEGTTVAQLFHDRIPNGKPLPEEIPNWTLHDLRRTARSSGW